MKSSGTTVSEQYLASLCQTSFLSLWSYPNVYKGKGKELCDLLVVFENNIIIFSDKSCEYKETGNLVTDWNRWYHRAIIKSTGQLYGAERHIKTFPNRLFLDSKAQSPLPLQLPPDNEIRIYKVAVALGAKSSCVKFYGGGSGSLRISSELYPIMNSLDEKMKAFTVGWHDSSKGFVHILDDITLDVLLRELDTIADFIQYLQKKEELFKEAIVCAGGEEELLAIYMQRIDENGYHGFDFQPENSNNIFADEGCWKSFIRSEHYTQKKEADKISYVWDKMIEHFSEIYDSKKFNGKINFDDIENVLRYYASLNRFERRVAGEKFKDFFTASTLKIRFGAIYLKSKPEQAYAFVLCVKPLESTIDEYQTVLGNLMDAYSNCIKLKFPDVKYVIALGTEPPKPKYSPIEILTFKNFKTWGEQDEIQARKDMEMLGLKLDGISFTAQEFPNKM